jgi:thymidylate synthase
MDIIARTSKEAWIKSIQHIIANGTEHELNKGKIKQVLNLNLIINEPEIDITEPISIISRSDKWLYPTIDEIKKFFLMKKIMHPYGYTYGQRMFNFNNGVNQIDDFIIPYISDKKNKNTRRLFVSLWDPTEDSKLDLKMEMPGLVGIWFKMVDNQITATAIIRNNDCFIGFPANLYQIHLLQKYISEKTGYETGHIVFYSLSIHVYLDHIEDIKKMLDI